MFESGSWLWRWLADQPPFVEVGIGISFVLVLAPVVLAAVAVAFSQLEMLVASVAAERLIISPSARKSQHPGDRMAPMIGTIQSNPLTKPGFAAIAILPRPRLHLAQKT